MTKPVGMKKQAPAPPGITPARSARKAPAGSAENSETRNAILEATIAIMLEEGYAAVSSRKIGARAGLRSNLVHYYFATMDDLFLAVYKFIEDKHFARLSKALAARRPIQSLWRMSMDETNTRIVLELNALASHRKALRAEIARASGRLRMLQAAVIERTLADAGGKPVPIPPMVLSVLALAVSRLLAMDGVMGVSLGHDETLRSIEALIDHVELGTPLTLAPTGSCPPPTT